MPNRDGTGPAGKGRGQGRRFFRRNTGTKECTCPKCGYKETSERGVPCSEKKCPKCGTPMKGPNCI